jgi:hypothetical protein
LKETPEDVGSQRVELHLYESAVACHEARCSRVGRFAHLWRQVVAPYLIGFEGYADDLRAAVDAFLEVSVDVLAGGVEVTGVDQDGVPVLPAYCIGNLVTVGLRRVATERQDRKPKRPNRYCA